MAKFLRSQDFKITFKQNLTCIFFLSELIQKTQFAMTDPVFTKTFIFKCLINTTSVEISNFIIKQKLFQIFGPVGLHS